MGRGDRREALSRKASYPEGSSAGDAVEKVLDFYGVDHGVVKYPAYVEPWDDDEARRLCFNKSCVYPVLGCGWTNPKGRFDDRKQEEVYPPKWAQMLRCRPAISKAVWLCHGGARTQG